MKQKRTNTQKHSVKRPNKTKKHLTAKRIILLPVCAIIVIVAGIVAYFANLAFNTYIGKGDKVRIYIPRGSTVDAITDTLTLRLGDDFGADVARLWRIRGGDPERAAGSYVITTGDKAWSVTNRLRVGAQTPVKVTFNQVRTLDDLATRISPNMAFDSAAFIDACSRVLPERGFTQPQFIGAFIPDTYDFYWTSTAERVVKRLAEQYDKIWNGSRRQKALTLGLTPIQVTTLASIVEEETAKPDERPLVARLYLNRLDKGMKLQADPTVKFAIGDFTIRRVTNTMLATQSPYNTYLNAGLPPGPIRIVETATIDAVLDAPEHDYLYMCARPDFSGYHNFATDYATHLANAKRYQQQLDERGIGITQKQ